MVIQGWTVRRSGKSSRAIRTVVAFLVPRVSVDVTTRTYSIFLYPNPTTHTLIFLRYMGSALAVLARDNFTVSL